ncbi:MAG: cupin domain-containing protein [Kosmotoga sp.]|nr:MAG: cupin domain-containing protein [Kosmotoga sp.]
MKITRLVNVEPTLDIEKVTGKIVYDHQEAQAVIIEIKPGGVLKPHKTPVDIFVYVIDGEGVFSAGNEKEKLGKNELVEIPKEIPHGIENFSNDKLTVMVLKAPKP